MVEIVSIRIVEVGPSIQTARIELPQMSSLIPCAYSHKASASPNSAKTLDNLGLSLETANRFSEALERFQQAVEADPDSADAQCHLGMALARAHRLEEAREHLQRALQISPDFAEARAGLRDVQKALGLAP